MDDPGNHRSELRRAFEVAGMMLLAALVGYLGFLAWVLHSLGEGGDEDEDECYAALEYAGHDWEFVTARKEPVEGEVLGVATASRCDGSPEEKFQVRAVRGVDPERAVLINGNLHKPRDAALPWELSDAQTPVRCELDGTFRLRGHWESVTGGDASPAPYVMDFWTADQRVARPYARVLLGVHGTEESRPMDYAEVRSMMWDDGLEVLTTHCDHGRFVVDSMDPLR